MVHRIWLVQPSADVACLESSPVQSESPWPPGPPWQELHVHDSPTGGRVLMLVGRAGTSHWSMAVSVDDPQRAIVFDVACRVHSQPAFLGSVYEIADGVTPAPRDAGDAIVLVPAGGAAPAVMFESLAIDEEPAPRVELHRGQIIVRANLDARPPATIRWKYRVRLAA